MKKENEYISEIFIGNFKIEKKYLLVLSCVYQQIGYGRNEATRTGRKETGT